jgi:DNA primase
MILQFTEIERKKIVELAQKTLWEDDAVDSKEALVYLKDKRKLSDDVIKNFGFGYIPKHSRHEWSERIIMPLNDPYGELVVLTSRKFTGDKKFSHLHEAFDKRYYLYGLDVARKSILEKNKAVIVEGQFDVTYLRSQGIRTVIGVLGSAFTMEHACLLRRYCTEVYLVFDADESGKLTLERSMDMMRDEKIEDNFGMRFIPVHLPSNLPDPDDYVMEKGAAAFCDLLETARISRFRR